MTASFAVDANLPADFRAGTFVPGKRYDAWIRFSNGSQADDRENDARGMAIKVFGAEGPKLPGHEGADTQDFVLATGPAFPQADASAFLTAMRGLELGTPMPEVVKRAVAGSAPHLSAGAGRATSAPPRAQVTASPTPPAPPPPACSGRPLPSCRSQAGSRSPG